MSHHSKELAQRWDELTLAQQLANVGSEVSRMTKWRGRNAEVAGRAFERMLELMDLTLQSNHSFPQLKEVARARELMVGCWLVDGPEMDREWAEFNRYFLSFAVLARKQAAPDSAAG